jgi:hypothetical protein
MIKNSMDKSAVKKAYKESKQPMGVYGITNTDYNKTYIGCGIDVRAKLNRQKAELKFGKHRNRELQEEWNKLGESAFLFEVVDVLEQKEEFKADHAEELRTLTEIWVQKLKNAGRVVMSL